MAGESDRFRAELVELLPRLRRFGRALCGNGADADDLVQTTIEKALLRADQWSAGSRLDWWTFRIMKNAWIDTARSRATRARIHGAPELAEAVAGESESSVLARLQLREVENAMAELPDEQRLAISLVLIEGFSYGEAAKLLEIPIGTLTSRLARGRAALEAALGGGET
jgi:RNA polymerase sigma factor (sigma-70 family)